MFRSRSVCLLTCFLFAAAFAGVALAANEGQDALDKATQLKVTAESLDDLGEVVDHLDTALEKGLDKENTTFAKQMLVSSLLQRGQLYAAAVFNVSMQDPQRNLRAMQFRQFALSDLQRVISMDDKVLEAQLLIGKLQSLPLGDGAAARRALSKVIDSADASPEQKAEAFALRSGQQKDEKAQMADLDRAIKLQQQKPDYLRLRAQRLYEKEKYADALKDVDAALKMEPDHAATNELRGMILLGMKKYDEALASFNRASELVPENPLPYENRGEVYRQKGDMKKALEQLNKAVELAPESLAALLVRAEVYYKMGQPDKALEDIDAAIRLQPSFAQSHLMRAEILAATNRVDQAISELERLLQASPNNVQLLDQLGSFYLVASRPRKAIEAATKALAQRADDADALRIRADASLNIGKHAEAIADFERAITIREDDESLENNFAWVLATSPDDKLRDGKKALKLAKKAAESSGYEIPHILSTLAAAYAETGDFDNAAKWSKKSVELAQKAVDAAKPKERSKMETDRDQLKKELETYQQHKPVRERQTAEDAPDSSTPPAEHAAAPTT